MNCHVEFLPSGKFADVPCGTILSDAAKTAGVFIDSPCGGNGTCKKCHVLLTIDDRQDVVLACQTKIITDCIVQTCIPDTISPLCSASVRETTFKPYPEAETDVKDACFAAFDLGTTTIVCYLLDAKSGRQIAASGMQNPQAAFGADVIARAAYSLEHGSAMVRQSALDALNRLLDEVCRACARNHEQVVLISLVGNTVMHHLLLDYPVDSLVRAPYQPYRSGRLILRASEIGITAHESCSVLVPPVIGGFVGADTVACMTATSFDALTGTALLIDIGTNGELALTDGNRIAVCATAAGPAFEGANISCGMRAVNGAIERFILDDGRLRYSVIGDGEAKGVCGSGLIELIALLCRSGTVDETGCLCTEGSLSKRVVQAGDGKPAFLVAVRENKSPLLLTQKDIRELQLAKAAMRAGAETLFDALSIRPEQVERVLLAGAFGTHLSAEALFGIGLLPRAISGHVQSVGNAAGEGAKAYLRNYDLYLQSEKLAQSAEYIELTVSPEFSERFVDAMAFPENTSID
jgi:uncharacterized 2Fe-2S/4Fe-4S cluster protein (DUF4445 family)